MLCYFTEGESKMCDLKLERLELCDRVSSSTKILDPSANPVQS